MTSTDPTSIRAALIGGMDLFDEAVARLGHGDLNRPTPCLGWTVADLVRHTGDTADRIPAFFAGERFVAVDGEVDPLAHWARARAGAAAAIESQELDERWPAAADSPHAKLLFNANDFAVHRWDLLSALGVEQELPGPWVDYLDRFFRSQPTEVLRRPRAFGDPLTPEPGDGPTRTLMAFLGRRPVPAS